MNRCPKCQVDYPDSVPLSPITGVVVTQPICGICALEMINELHGIRRSKFRGEMAEFNRQLAVEFRQKIGYSG